MWLPPSLILSYLINARMSHLDEDGILVYILQSFEHFSYPLLHKRLRFGRSEPHDHVLQCIRVTRFEGINLAVVVYLQSHGRFSLAQTLSRLLENRVGGLR